MLFTTGTTQHTHIFYELPQAADQLGMSETVLVRLSQYFKIPALAYEEEGYLSFKGELLFSEPDIRFFKMVKERLMSGATLPQVKQEAEISAKILPVAQPVLESTGSLNPVPLSIPERPQATPVATPALKPVQENTSTRQPLPLEKQASLGMPKSFETNPYQSQPPRPAFQRQPLPSASAQENTVSPMQGAFPTPQVSNHHILKSMIYSQQHQQTPAHAIEQPANDPRQKPITPDKAGYVSQPGDPASGFNRWHPSQESTPARAQVAPPETASLHQAHQVIQESFDAFGNVFGNMFGHTDSPAVRQAGPQQGIPGSMAGNSLHQRFATPPQTGRSQANSGKQTPGLSYELREALAGNHKA